jgi:hypothetical protein
LLHAAAETDRQRVVHMQRADRREKPCALTPPPVSCPHAGAGNDYQKDLQFRKLNAVKDIIEIKVVRNGDVKVSARGRVLRLLLLRAGSCVAAAACST